MITRTVMTPVRCNGELSIPSRYQLLHKNVLRRGDREPSQQLEKTGKAAKCSLVGRPKVRRTPSDQKQQRWRELETRQDVSWDEDMDKTDKWGKPEERRGVRSIVMCAQGLDLPQQTCHADNVDFFLQMQSPIP